MKKLMSGLLTVGLMSMATPAYATFVVAGDLNTEQGDLLDWDPFFSSLLMTESGGVHTVTPINLLDGTPYSFEIFDDEGTGPAEASDPKVSSNILTLYGDSDGAATITVDTNQTNAKGQPRTWVNFDTAPLQVVGDFMDEAGGAGDWNPADPTFAMTALGNGYYTYEAVISTPGTYQFKASFGNGWTDQVGQDGFNDNAITRGFNTFEVNETVTMFVDLANQELGTTQPIAPFGTFYVAGELQTEQGDAADWDPAISSLIVVESGGIHTVTANNLVNGTPYDFKVVNDAGAPPVAWGDPEITPDQLTAYGDADGSIEITVDTNVINNIGQPATWINFDDGPIQVVGDFMDEAGGAADWDPADPSFLMTPEGNGYYTFDTVISTPGIYQFKATFGLGWDDQIGSEGFSNNALSVGFETTAIDEAVTLFVDLTNRMLGIESGSLQGDLDGDGFVGISDLNIVLASWNQNVPPGNPLADPSGDNFVGIDDLNEVLGNWNAGTPPNASASIPEPASLTLLGIGGLAAMRRRN